MADMEKVYDDLTIINLYLTQNVGKNSKFQKYLTEISYF